jgi:hypothetical protein
MKFFKLLFLLNIIFFAHSPLSAKYPIDGTYYKDEAEIIKWFYIRSDNYINSNISNKLISSLDLEKIDGKFLLISPEKNFYTDNFQAWGVFKAKKEQQMMLALDMKLKTEIVWHYLEIMGLVKHLDIIDENFVNHDLKQNYDYIINFNCQNCDGIRKLSNVENRTLIVDLESIHNKNTSEITKIVGAPYLSKTKDSSNLEKSFPGISIKFFETVQKVNGIHNSRNFVKNYKLNINKRVNLSKNIVECYYDEEISIRIAASRECPW